jgi:diguanylate cyclase
MVLAIWSFHYTAMLAFHLPVPARYQLTAAFLALCIAILRSAIASSMVTGEQFGWRVATIAALFNGAGILRLHYTALASMRAGRIDPHAKD